MLIPRRSSIMKRMELRRLATLLTPQERKQGWRLPPRRHTTYKRVASAGSPSHLEGNRFAVLAKLLCSQRKELDRTGTPRMSTKRQPREQLQKQQQQQEQKQKKPLKSKRRSKGSRSPSPTSGPCKRSRVESVSVNVVVTAPDSPPRSPPRQTQPHQMITRSRAAAMPTPPTFHTLQAERRVDLSAIPRLSASPGPVPTVSSYMVEGGPEPISNEELSRRLFEMELENKRLRELLLAKEAAEEAQQAASTSAAPPADRAAQQVAGPSTPLRPIMTQAETPPQVQPAAPAFQPAPVDILPQRAMFEQFLAEWWDKQGVHTSKAAPLTLHRPYPIEIEMEPFPNNFTMPQFSQFGGKGCPRQHLLRFTSSMGNYAHHSNFCLRLFPNSLTGDAFQWYMTLPAGSVKT